MTKQLNSYDRIPDYKNGSYFSTKAEDLQEWADRAGVSLEKWCFYQTTFRHILGMIDRGTDEFSLKDCLLQMFKRHKILIDQFGTIAKAEEYLEKQNVKETD